VGGGGGEGTEGAHRFRREAEEGSRRQRRQRWRRTRRRHHMKPRRRHRRRSLLRHCCLHWPKRHLLLRRQCWSRLPRLQRILEDFDASMALREVGEAATTLPFALMVAEAPSSCALSRFCPACRRSSLLLTRRESAWSVRAPPCLAPSPRFLFRQMVSRAGAHLVHALSE